MIESNRIIAVRPTEETFTITWMLGSLCNYDCMYCSTEWHDSNSKPSALEELQRAWINIYGSSKHLGLPYKIAFTGGEVTANKSFLPFVTWLRQEFDSVKMILITTNGSASIRYYRKLAGLVESLSFSTHSEFMDEAEFFTKVRELNTLMIKPNKSLHVNIMDEPWHTERIKDYVSFCQRHAISHSINRVNMQLRTRNTNRPLPERNLDRLV